MSCASAQIAPPLNCCGVSLTSHQISVSFAFQVAKAPSRFSTIQLSSKYLTPSENPRLLRRKQAGVLQFVLFRTLNQTGSLSLIARSASCQNQIQDLFGKRYNQPAEESQEAGTALRRVVRLEAQSDLHHAPSKQDHANGLDGRKDKRGKVIDCGQGVISCGESGRTDGAAQRQSQRSGEIVPFCPSCPVVGSQSFFLHVGFPPVVPKFQDV